MTQRKTSIEMMRFLAAMLVVYGHTRQLIYPDTILSEIVCIIVDFFFLLSGFFAARDALEKETAPNQLAAADAVKYSFRRAKGIYGAYFFALVLTFVLRTAAKGAFSLPDTLKELFHFKWEFLLIHMAGFNHAPAFNVDYLLGPVWFLSALLIALVPFFFLCRRYGKNFTGVGAPLCAMLIYAYIVQNYDTIDVGNQFVLVTMLGNLRAFAGLCVGAFVCHVNGWLEESPDSSKAISLLRVLDPISWLIALSLFVLPKGLIPNSDAVFWLFPLSVLVLNCINDCGVISHWLNHHCCKLLAWLGRLSMYIYLFHVPVLFIWAAKVKIGHPIAASILIMLVVIAFSALVMTVREKLIASRSKKL